MTKCEKVGNEKFNLMPKMLIRIRGIHIRMVVIGSFLFLFMYVFNVNLSTCLLLKFPSFEGLALARLCSFFFYWLMAESA